MNKRIRIYMTGVGGQGTLTATTLLARVALDCGLEVVAGEIHGMAQRGGVVESFVLLGGWRSPKIGLGEADVLLGFEPLESLRGLPYLAAGGTVFTSLDTIPCPGVCAGRECAPETGAMIAAVRSRAGKAWGLPIRAMGAEAGSVQSGNSVLLGALCASGVLPFDGEALAAGIRKHLPAKLVDVNLRAAEAGGRALEGAAL